MAISIPESMVFDSLFSFVVLPFSCFAVSFKADLNVFLT